MPLIALSGTPGTGKTSVSRELRTRGYKVIDSNDHFRRFGLLEERDEERDTFNVDIDRFNDSLEEYRNEETVFLDSHLSHLVDSSLIIVLRCDPGTLSERLRKRGYPEQKIRENVQAEILDVILCESMESGIPVHELDCTKMPISEAVDFIERILNGETELCPPGKVDWSGEMEEWF